MDIITVSDWTIISLRLDRVTPLPNSTVECSVVDEFGVMFFEKLQQEMDEMVSRNKPWLGANMLRLAIVVSSVIGIGNASLHAQSVPDAGMLRYPDVSAERIVFVYANDLWTVDRSGGLAMPLASPPGTETNPRFSPDGSEIAFVGSYDAGDDIYKISTYGGMAERVTYHSANETLYDWSSDGRLIYGTNGFAGLGRMTQLYTISENHPHPMQLPVPYGSNGAISSDGKWLAYTPYSRDTRTWKRYRGGMASDLWLMQLESKRSQQITDWEGTDSFPMWHDQTVYYLSDAGAEHRLNIWKYDTNTQSKEQVTKHADFDVKWPAIGPGAEGEGEIVYQQGSSLWLLDLASGESTSVSVQIPGDRPRLRKQQIDASDYVSSASISPTGKRVAVEARGDIWSAAAENGLPRNLTATSGIAERYPSWSPDGRWIAYFSDATDEYELMITQSDGRGETRRLTDDGTHWRFNPIWSPNSEHIVFTDKTGAILLHTISEKSTVQIDREPAGGPPSVSWSHDSNLFAYAKSDGGRGTNSAIWVYNVSDAESKRLTSGYFNDSEPAFDREGDFLYYQSNRSFNSPSYEDLGTTFIYEDTGVLLALPLRADVKNPLLKKVDEVEWEEDESEPSEEGDEEDEDDEESENPSDDSEEDDDGEEDEDNDTDEGDEDDEGTESSDPVSGTWDMTIDSPAIPDEARNVTLVLRWDGKSLSGEITVPTGETLGLEDAKFDPQTRAISAAVSSPMGKVFVEGTVGDDEITGKVRIAGAIEADFSATRESVSAEGESDSPKSKTKSKKKPIEKVVIEFEGAERRVIPLPVGNGNFSGLVVNASNQLIYRKSSSGNSTAIKIFNLKADKPKEQDVVSGGGGFELSADGKKLLLIRGGTISITDAGAGKGPGKSIETDGMMVSIDPREEWNQLLSDAWRLERDFFYDPNMHGVDWPAIRKQYTKLLKDATSRSDVGFIIGEMISELNVGHAYYRGVPDDANVSRSSAAVLGCALATEDGFFKIDHFYEGGPWDTDAQSPLRVAGAQEGQFILEVEGRRLSAEENPYMAMQGLAGKLVTLIVSDDTTIDDDDPRISLKLPGNDSDLRFRHWIESKRAKVNELSGGKIGYIYVVNTGVPGQNDLFRQFYAQLDKEALIIDDRWNGGGQIPTRFIELLNRPVTNYWARRDSTDWRWPPDSHQGPKCMLINGLAGSGGDMFPALFRQAKLGKLIGQRTWGGLVGISGGPQLIDGASVTMPSFAYYDLDGTWGIEGHGVDPDIEVIDDPALMQDGGDPQLAAAVNHLLEELEQNAFTPPERPAYPDRSEMGIAEEDK